MPAAVRVLPMKYTYLAVVLAAVLIAAGVGAYWLFFASMSGAENNVPSSALKKDFSAEGVVVKDKPGFKEGAWYFEYSNAGTPETVHILFSKISTCAWKETSGPCKPSLFVNGRKARIEGIVLEDAIGVMRLTFTESVSTK